MRTKISVSGAGGAEQATLPPGVAAMERVKRTVPAPGAFEKTISRSSFERQSPSGSS